ncbi:MAG: zinc-ribbon domain-containing protein, partial [Polyangiaceae bacterium]
MNVTCTGCPAKYAVPDEKVRGKKVRITCKHCGTNIVVDGNALGADPNLAPKAAAESAPRPATASAPDLTSAAPAPAVARKAALAAAPEPTFVVGFLDDRQESHTLTQVVEMYRSGQIDDDVLVWKDGMADWLSPFDVPEVATAMLEHGVTRNSANADSASAGNEAQISIAHPPVEDAELAAAAAPAPLIATAPVLAAALSPNAFGRSKSEAQPAVPPVAQPLEGSATIAPATATPAPKAAAARRSEPRGGAVDLFGSLAEAGGESDSSLDFGSASESGDEPGHKLTGARNESSVLFSLDALTRPEAKATQKQRAREKEDEASAALFGDSAPNSLMNVGGGGLAALAAPDFTKPISANVEPLHATGAAEVHDTTPPNQKKGGWVLLLGSLFGIAAIAGGAFW